jgi:hypothetical protein
MSRTATLSAVPNRSGKARLSSSIELPHGGKSHADKLVGWNGPCP